MKVLLYYNGSNRSIALETLLRAYVQQGHECHLFTSCEPGELHKRVEAFGVRASGVAVPKDRLKLFYGRNVYHLVRYCRRERIDVVLSQLQDANIVGVFAERMTRARFYMFRHHPHPHILKARIIDWIVNHLARKIVVLTEVHKQIVRHEGVPEGRILLLPPMYDFDEYKVSVDAVRSIRNAHQCDLLVIMMSRLVHYKRHMPAFQAVEKLVAQGRNIKLLVMDDGPEREALERFVRERSLQNNISLLGYRPDVLDYLEASDVLLQPSESEVSAHAVKEAGLRGKIVIACRGVGDFDEYLEDMDDAALLNVTDGPSAIADRLADILDNPEAYSTMGARLRQRVLEKFARTQSITDQYLRLVDGPSTSDPTAGRSVRTGSVR